MIDLSKRSLQKELLDRDDIPFEDIKQNLIELNKINTSLGGHKVTINGLRNIIRKTGIRKPVTICEIGCGGGDNLMMLKKWCDKQHIPAQFKGIDIKSECISFCVEKYSDSAEWICSDYRTAQVNETDIIFSSLFCHHFTDQELAAMMIWMKENSKAGFFINDLHRNGIAYHSIKLLTEMFSRSYLVKHDAPLSVARGFVKKDFEILLKSAGLNNYTIEWKWAFRYLVTYIDPSFEK